MGVRSILALLRRLEPDKSWKLLVEGALFEERIGNIAAARHVFSFIMVAVRWLGPVFLEAIRLEERSGDHVRALAIAQVFNNRQQQQSKKKKKSKQNKRSKI